jgi:hypothetical protein
MRLLWYCRKVHIHHCKLLGVQSRSVLRYYKRSFRRLSPARASAVLYPASSVMREPMLSGCGESALEGPVVSMLTGVVDGLGHSVSTRSSAVGW